MKWREYDAKLIMSASATTADMMNEDDMEESIHREGKCC
jgi:hypothetical protein